MYKRISTIVFKNTKVKTFKNLKNTLAFSVLFLCINLYIIVTNKIQHNPISKFELNRVKIIGIITLFMKALYSAVVFNILCHHQISPKILS